MWAHISARSRYALRLRVQAPEANRNYQIPIRSPVRACMPACHPSFITELRHDICVCVAVCVTNRRERCDWLSRGSRTPRRRSLPGLVWSISIPNSALRFNQIDYYFYYTWILIFMHLMLYYSAERKLYIRDQFLCKVSFLYVYVYILVGCSS